MKLAQMDFNELLIHTTHYRLEKPNLKHLVQVSDIINMARGLFGIPLLVELSYELTQLNDKS